MMTQDTATSLPPKTPRRRWLRLLLFVSLAFNIAVIGIVGGTALNHSRGDDHPVRMSRELGLRPYLFAFDDDGRAAIRNAAAANRDSLRASREAWKTAFAETVDVLRAETFDADRFDALVARQAELAAAGRGIGQKILSAQVATMTAEERSDFADRLEKGLRFQKHRGGRYKGGPTKD